MPAETDARVLLQSLIGHQIQTVRGRPNTVLGIEGENVIVATGRSPSRARARAWIADVIDAARTLP